MAITQMTRGGWKATSNTPTTGISEIKTEAPDGLARKSARKPLPPVLDGMDKAEALAYVSRLFDAAQAGAAVWGDALLIKRFITQCSRTDSEATRAACRFDLRSRSSVAGVSAITHTCTCGRSILRSARTGWTSFAAAQALE